MPKKGDTMLKKSIYSFCLGILSLTSTAIGGESDFITYEWLSDCARKSGYTDHIPHFRRLFNTIKVQGFLECGCGFSTKYFLDNCDKVISIEFLNPGNDDRWYQECLKLYKDCPNWVPLTYNADHKDVSFNNACAYANSAHKDYSLIDSSYMQRLDLYFKDLISRAHQEGKDIDVAFVDPGVYTRGEMVKVLLANKVPIVMAHDTACDKGPDANEGHYIWFVVKTPADYEKIYIPFGQGTTFWISKKLPEVIKSITDYRNMVLNGPHTFDAVTQMADQF